LIVHQIKKKSRRRGSSTTEQRGATEPNDVWSWDSFLIRQKMGKRSRS
jgi:hypothetical protein